MNTFKNSTRNIVEKEKQRNGSKEHILSVDKLNSMPLGLLTDFKLLL